MQKTRLYYAGQPGQGYGWGTCNTYLRKELEKLGVLAYGQAAGDVAVFMPLADHDFNPISNVRGTYNLAYTFFEFPLGPNAAENAKKYDVVFCGSTWCLERMRERGITNGEVLIQGVDHEIFKPMDVQRQNRFTIFSGGKFEYRKGQDLVIAAFKEFLKIDPQALLVCSWFNPWPSLIGGMGASKLNFPKETTFSNQEEFYAKLLMANGIPEYNFRILPAMPQRDLAKAMNCSDVGLFPNRCEGGTNLVMMEYMSCGKPVVATCGTGHMDVLGQNARHSPKSFLSENYWREAVPESIVRELEFLHENQIPRKLFGQCSSETMHQWTWERTARQIVERLERI